MTHAVYPKSTFFHNGGRLIDVTQPPFNAKGDGKADDTAAIVKAYDFIADMIRQRIEDGVYWPIADMYTIYLPNGEYLVSDSLVYTREALVYRKHGQSEGLNNIRFQGESREGTTIRLKDNSPGFEAGQIKPIISMSRRDDNNLQTFNSVENLTINSGSGNPGAVGINHAGANKTSLRNLLIQSGDGQGVAGIYIKTSPTQGYHTDITIEGFNYGLWMVPYHVTHNSFEYITLKDQKEAAIVLDDATSSLRAIKVENCAGPALLQRGAGSQVAVIESSFEASDSTTKIPAIKFQTGSIFARNITTQAYTKLIESRLLKSPNGTRIDEITYPAPLDIPLSATGKSPRSLNLPVEDEPAVLFPDTAEGWADVDDYLPDTEASQETPDYRQALQDALNSGKGFVLFGRQQKYYISGPVTVPPSVKVINGLHTIIQVNKDVLDPLFMVAENSPEPLTIENIQINGNCIAHKALRTICLRNLGTRGRNPYQNLNTEPGAKLFLTSATNMGKIDGSIHNQKVWARWVDTEASNFTDFPLQSSDVWVFGYKTEKFRTCFAATKGSRLEVLGGVTNQFHPKRYLEPYGGISPYPAFLVKDSEASIFACTNGPSSPKLENYKVLLEVDKEGQSWTYEKLEAPQRIGRRNQAFLPLAVVRNEH